MDDTLKRLLHDVAAATGAELPAVVGDDAPVPDARAIDDSVYFVGLIGGKEVGKSSLVNALIGKSIVTPTGFGRGTSRATAYAHESVAPRVRDTLQHVLAGKFDLVTHREASAGRVLLDLPDVDSVWSEHVEITRTLLRLMLYPVWVQSVEKYADQQPLELLKQVAAGNDPANFLFVLNKADQVAARYGDGAVVELRDDYAARVQRACGLTAPPRVFVTAARDPAAFDLPLLARTVTAEKSSAVVARDRNLAEARQGHTALQWLDQQHLPARHERARRLLDTAQELCAARLGVPLVEEAVPRLLADPAHRMAVTEPIARVRLGRWPVVNVIDAIATPLVALVRANLTKSVSSSTALDSSSLVVAPRVRAIFAELAQSDPAVVTLYGHRKLWEETASLAAAADLGERVRSALDRQKAAALEELAGPPRPLGTLWRVLLTIGAILWFPVVQPVLEIFLSGALKGLSWATIREPLVLLIRILSATYLLQSLTFLSMYFVVLWMVVRWGVYHRAERFMKKLRDVRRTPADLNPAAAALDWIEDLTGPLRQQHARVKELADRAALARAQEKPAAKTKAA